MCQAFSSRKVGSWHLILFKFAGFGAGDEDGDGDYDGSDHDDCRDGGDGPEATPKTRQIKCHVPSFFLQEGWVMALYLVLFCRVWRW